MAGKFQDSKKKKTKMRGISNKISVFKNHKEKEGRKKKL
jgi:hypothetical protein